MAHTSHRLSPISGTSLSVPPCLPLDEPRPALLAVLFAPLCLPALLAVLSSRFPSRPVSRVAYVAFRLAISRLPRLTRSSCRYHLALRLALLAVPSIRLPFAPPLLTVFCFPFAWRITARPVPPLSQLCLPTGGARDKFDCYVTVKLYGSQFNSKSPMVLVDAGFKCGTEIEQNVHRATLVF